MQQGAFIASNVGTMSAGLIVTYTTCWKYWWRTQSQSNLSLHPNSLICGNLQGIFAICRNFGLRRIGKNRKISGYGQNSLCNESANFS